MIKKLREGKNLLLSIDVKGAMTIRRKFPNSVLILLKPPSLRELRRRLKVRDTDGDIEIARRMKRARQELAYGPRYDYVVINDRLENAVCEIIGIIRENLERTK